MSAQKYKALVAGIRTAFVLLALSFPAIAGNWQSAHNRLPIPSVLARPELAAEPPPDVLQLLLPGYCINKRDFEVYGIQVASISVVAGGGASSPCGSAGVGTEHGNPIVGAIKYREAISHNSRVEFLIFPGYGMPKTSMLTFAKLVADMGFRALLIDLPGQGHSGGTHIGYGPLEAHYISKLVDRLYLQDGVQTIGLIGYSYGGAVALDVARLQPRIGAAIAIAPFAHTVAAIRSYIGLKKHVRNDGSAGLVASVEQADKILGYYLETTGPIRFVSGIRAPTLIIGGANDKIGTADDMERLSSKVRRGSLVIIPHADHAQLLTSSLVQSSIRTWLKSISISAAHSR